MPRAKKYLRVIAFTLALVSCLLHGAVLPARAADTDVNVKVCYPVPLPPPVITSPADGTATKDSSVLLEGTTTPNETVYAYRGGTQVGFVPADGTGQFAISVSLQIGTNALRAAILDDCDAPTYSSTVNVERQAVTPPPDPTPGGGETPVQPPASGETPTEEPSAPGGGQPGQTPGSPARPSIPGKVQILEPQDGLVVDSPYIRLRGSAPPNTRVRILLNKQIVAEVVSDDQGLFIVNITLVPGANDIFATIGNKQQTLLSQPITITYNPPQGIETSEWLVPAAVTVGLVGLGAAAYIYLLQPLFGDRIRIGKKVKKP